MNDEAYVRSVWEIARFPHMAADENSVLHIPGVGWSQSSPKAWSAAAEFTRERLEQVRQLREEIALMVTLRDGYAKNGPGMGALREEALRRGLLCVRILARLESALATLTQGMKPDVQP